MEKFNSRFHEALNVTVEISEEYWKLEEEGVGGVDALDS